MSKNSDTWNICFRPNNIHAHHPRFYICYQVFIDDVEKCWQGFSVVIPHFHPDAARFFSLSPHRSLIYEPKMRRKIELPKINIMKLRSHFETWRLIRRLNVVENIDW